MEQHGCHGPMQCDANLPTSEWKIIIMRRELLSKLNIKLGLLYVYVMLSFMGHQSKYQNRYHTVGIGGHWYTKQLVLYGKTFNVYKQSGGMYKIISILRLAALIFNDILHFQ